MSAVPIHHVTFERNTLTKMWRARCSDCGWARAGAREEVVNSAATHDMEWIEVDPRAETTVTA